MRTILIFGSCACLIVAVPAARADIVPTLFSTGMADIRTPLAPGDQDPHWLITDYLAVPPTFNAYPQVPFSAPFRPLRTQEFDSDGNFIIPFGNQLFNTNWMRNGRHSGWISLKSDYRTGNQDPTGFFTFQTQFNLSGYDPATARIVLFLWSDDNVVAPGGTTGVRLNGADTNVPPVVRPPLVDPPFFAPVTAQVPQGPYQILGGFVGGINTLDVILQNHYFETGLRMNAILIAFRPPEDPIPPLIVNDPIDNPGDYPGDYIQGPLGKICFDISGRSPKVQRFLIGRSAYLDGLLCLEIGSCLKGGDKFELIRAERGVFGEFLGISLEGEHDSPVLLYQLIYDENTVRLVISQNSYALFAQTPNQRAVGLALDKLVFDPKADELIRALNCAPQLPDALDRIAPTDLSSLYSISFSQASLLGMEIDDHLADARRGERGFSTNLPIDPKSGKDFLDPNDGNKNNYFAPSPENPWSIYATVGGDFGDIDNTGGANGFHFATGTAAIGAQYSPSPSLTVGTMVSYARNETDFRGDGGASMDSGRLVAYGSVYNDRLYLNGSIGGGYNSFSTKRDGFGGTARGDGDSEEVFASLSSGYEFRVHRFSYGPTASLQYANVWLNSWQERNSLAPLKISSQSQDSLRSSLGVRASYETTILEKPVMIEVRGAWEHEFAYESLPITAQVANTDGSDFTTRGPELGADSCLAGASLRVRWNERCSSRLSYYGQFARENYSSHSVTMSFERSF